MASPILQESVVSLAAEYRARQIGQVDNVVETMRAAAFDLLDYFAERLKDQLREQGARHDLVDAVFALEGQDDFLIVVRRVEALGKFLDTDDGKNLLAGTKRASNILAHRGKEGQATFDGAPDASLYQARRREDRSRAPSIR